MSKGLRLGQRVWVALEHGRAYGQVASLPAVFPASSGFVVLLSGKSVTCAAERRGSEWDLSDRDES